VFASCQAQVTIARKARTLFGRVNELAVGIGELEAADVQLEALGHARIAGTKARQGGERRRVVRQKHRLGVGEQRRLDTAEEDTMEQVVPRIIGREVQGKLTQPHRQDIALERREDREASVHAKCLIDADAPKGLRHVDDSPAEGDARRHAERARRGAHETFAVVNERRPIRADAIPLENAKLGAVHAGMIAVAKGGRYLIDVRQARGEHALHQQLGRGLQIPALAALCPAELDRGRLEMDLGRQSVHGHRRVDLDEALRIEEVAHGLHDAGATAHTLGIGEHRGTDCRSRGRCQQFCRAAALVTLALSFGFASAAHAAGFWTLEAGANAFARGGANIASANDPGAIFLNPSALSTLRGLQVMVDGNSVFDWRTFARQSDDLDGSGRLNVYDPVTNRARGLPPSPGAFIAYNLARLGLPTATLGAAMFGPPRTDVVFDAHGPQRYSLIGAHSLQVFSAAALAIELPLATASTLRLGCTGMLVRTLPVTNLRINVFAGTYSETESSDAEIALNAASGYTPVGVFSASLQPSHSFNAALTIQTPWTAHARGTAHVSFVDPRLARQFLVHGDGVDIEFKLPALVRAGLQFSAPDARYDAELAFVYEQWSRYRGVRVIPRDIYIEALGSTVKVSEMALPGAWRDAYSVRLGGRYDVVPGLVTLRGGAFYESSAVPLAWVSPSAFDANKLGVTTGARLELPYGTWLDLALGGVYWLPMHITDSSVRIVDPLTGGDLWPIGNGTYTDRQLYIMASLGMRFGV